jgi:Mn-dependent DtxR family transcriptional regulator
LTYIGDQSSVVLIGQKEAAMGYRQGGTSNRGRTLARERYARASTAARRHLLEIFLEEVLGLSGPQANLEAKILQDAPSEQVEQLIRARVGIDPVHPAAC